MPALGHLAIAREEGDFQCCFPSSWLFGGVILFVFVMGNGTKTLNQLFVWSSHCSSSGAATFQRIDADDWICAPYEGISCYLGLLMGYISALVYILGRVPQVSKNV
jgi:hypothetical protein